MPARLLGDPHALPTTLEPASARSASLAQLYRAGRTSPEYRRHFGEPPSRDIARLRASLEAGAGHSAQLTSDSALDACSTPILAAWRMRGFRRHCLASRSANDDLEAWRQVLDCLVGHVDGDATTRRPKRLKRRGGGTGKLLSPARRRCCIGSCATRGSGRYGYRRVAAPSARTAALATDHRHQKRLHRHIRSPVPLRYTSARIWRRSA